MRRLLFVVNDLPFFLSHRLPLALGALTAGYDVHLATPDHPRRREVENRGVTFHPILMSRSGMGPWGEYRSFRSLLRLYRDLRPDVVHQVTPKPVIYGSLAARVAGVRSVVNAISGLGHVFVARGWKADLRRTVVLQAYRSAFAHSRCRGIFQNPDDVALFREAGIVTEGQTLLIPGSGVDLAEFHPTPEPAGRPVVILPSRLLWDKGVGEFVAAARGLRDRGLEHRAVLVGKPDPGNPRAVPEEEVQRWVKEGVVEWWGHREDMPGVFAQSNVVCLPSTYREGVPKVLLEAAAAGRAIITTDVPGCRDVVKHENTGLLIPPRDPLALSAAIERLVEDPILRARLGSRARARAVAEFGIGRVVETTLGLYRELA